MFKSPHSRVDKSRAAPKDRPGYAPMAGGGQTRRCGKCSKFLTMLGCTGGKVHRYYGWCCPACSAPKGIQQ